MTLYTISLILLTFAYATVLLKLRGGLLKLKPGKNQKKLHVSIIISARNEEKNIRHCLTHILRQHYPDSKYEIIVVDDRSTDRTAKIVKELSRSHPQIRLLQIQEISTHLAPKKRAIDLGIRQSTGEIIVTTDADCTPGPYWIPEMIKYFDPDIGMVTGFTPYKTENSRFPLFHQMLALDYFAMACVSAASSGLNYPVSCSGGNLAYRKELFGEVGGFKNIGNWISGDDDFFLEKVRATTKWKIRYATNPNSFVPTLPPGNIREFINQRIRYASKGAYYKWPLTLALLCVYSLNLLILSGPFLALFNLNFLPVWSLAVIIKFVSERSFLRKAHRLFNMNFRFSTFLVTSLIHPIYIVIAGLLGQFKSFKWKGEKYSAKSLPQNTISSRGRPI